jgi:uncharacterized protein
MKLVISLVAIAAALGCAAPATAAHPQRPAGPVLDEANVIPASDEAALSDRLSKYYQTSGNAIVVATVTSLDGETIEDYANELFGEWRVGDADTDRGVLLLLAPNDHQARIEVGCGLEGTVTNGIAEQIMQTKLIPQYHQQHFLEGTLAGVNALIDYLDTSTRANGNCPHSQVCLARIKGSGQ